MKMPKIIYLYGDNNSLLTLKPTKNWIKENKPVEYVRKGEELRTLKKTIISEAKKNNCSVETGTGITIESLISYIDKRLK